MSVVYRGISVPAVNDSSSDISGRRAAGPEKKCWTTGRAINLRHLQDFLQVPFSLYSFTFAACYRLPLPPSQKTHRSPSNFLSILQATGGDFFQQRGFFQIYHMQKINKNPSLCSGTAVILSTCGNITGVTIQHHYQRSHNINRKGATHDTATISTLSQAQGTS